MGNSFEASQTLEERNWPNYDKIYSKVFGTTCDRKNYEESKENKEIQRKDIDGFLHLSDRDLPISEKARATNYGDILLENCSVLEDKVPGWAFKSEAELLSYAIVGNKFYVYLIDDHKLKDFALKVANTIDLIAIQNELVRQGKTYTKKNIVVDGKPISISIIVSYTKDKSTGKILYHTGSFAVTPDVLESFNIQCKKEELI